MGQGTEEQYRDDATFASVWNKASGLAEVAAYFGKSKDAVAKRSQAVRFRGHPCKDMRFVSRARPGVAPPIAAKPEVLADDSLMPQNEQEARLIGLLQKKPRSAEVISEILNISQSAVYGLVEKLNGKGYDIFVDEPTGKVRLYMEPTPAVEPIDLRGLEGDEVVVSAFSDVHAGSKFQQLTMWNLMAQICEKKKVRHAFHAGDLFDGRGMYRGQEQEIFLHGAEDQRQYVTEKFPHMSQVYTIAGNHDNSYKKSVGYNIVRHFSDQREDWQVIGETVGEVLLPEGIKVQMRHPSGGLAYARSYRLQKINEGLGRKEDLPDIIIFGHYHMDLYMQYLGIHMFAAGTFQAQTSYLADKGADVDLGFWLIKLNWAKKKKQFNWIEPRWYNLARFASERNW